MKIYYEYFSILLLLIPFIHILLINDNFPIKKIINSRILNFGKINKKKIYLIKLNIALTKIYTKIRDNIKKNKKRNLINHKA